MADISKNAELQQYCLTTVITSALFLNTILNNK